MQQFITENELKFIRVKININPETNKKQFIAVKKGWKEMTFKELKAYENSLNKAEGGHYLIELGNNFLVFDTDTAEDYEALILILKELNIYVPDAITLSTRGDLYAFKRHFWFKITTPETFDITGPKRWGSLDVFSGTKGQVAERKATQIENIPELTIENYKRIKSIFNPTDVPEQIKTDYSLRCLLEHLNPNRFIKYDSWLILYFIFKNEDFDLNLFNEFSKKYYPAFDETKNTEILNKIKPRVGYTKATLYYWLKEDNILYFRQLKNEDDYTLELFNYNSHNNMLKLFYQANSKKYLFCQSSGWFIYGENNILKSVGPKIPSQAHIEFHDFLKKELTELIIRVKDDKELVDKINKMNNKCFQHSYISDVLKKANVYFNVPDVDKLIDTNLNLIAFTNCLYDKTINDFRPIETTDYICFNAGFAINKTRNSEARKTIDAFYNTIFEDVEMTNYSRKITADCLIGNGKEKFIINTGRGRNGKGVLSSLIKYCVGDYYYQADSSFFVSEYKSGAPNPTLYNSKKRRYFYSSEPEGIDECKLNSGAVKSATGGDTLPCRGLFKDTYMLVPTWTPIMECNQKPAIESTDEAIKNRLIIINFPFTFVSEPKEKHHRKIDGKLKTTLLNPEVRNEFILMLIDEFNKDYPVPKKVLNELNEYIQENNTVEDFIRENYDFTECSKDRIQAIALLEDYNSSGEYPRLSNSKFSKNLKFMNLESVKSCGRKFYIKIKPKIFDKENELD